MKKKFYVPTDYCCGECEKNFKNRKTWKQHMDKIHSLLPLVGIFMLILLIGCSNIKTQIYDEVIYDCGSRLVKGNASRRITKENFKKYWEFVKRN